MQPNTSQTLGGEGWPALDIARRAENRNNIAPLRNSALQVRASSSRTKHEQAGTVGTKSTQQTKFEFTRRSTSNNSDRGYGAPLCVIPDFAQAGRAALGRQPFHGAAEHTRQMKEAA